MRGWLAALEQGLAHDDRSAIYGVLRDAVPNLAVRLLELFGWGSCDTVAINLTPDQLEARGCVRSSSPLIGTGSAGATREPQC